MWVVFLCGCVWIFLCVGMCGGVYLCVCVCVYLCVCVCRWLGFYYVGVCEVLLWAFM